MMTTWKVGTMGDSNWDSKLKGFLKKAGDDFKRAGADIKVEAEKLMRDVQDPEKQKKMREGLKDVGVWAKKTAEEVAGIVETGVKKAEDAFRTAANQPAQRRDSAADAPAPAPASTPPSPPPDMSDAAPASAPKKTAGKRAPAKKKKPKKTIGRTESGED